MSNQETEYAIQSNPQTLPKPLSAYLKHESTSLTRVEVPAEKGTKMGAFVEYPLRGKKYIALSDEQNGKVQIQPHSCVMNLAEIAESDIIAARTDLATMKKEDDAFGIVYVGEPKK